VARGEKAVVFSAHKPLVEHLAVVLADAGVGFRKICAAAGRRDAQARAASEWSSERALPVLLLHAGVAAAGLTLVAARHVFVLDVLWHAAEELQALNRCHRIGQDRDVECVVYYAQGTVEERLLARRASEAADRGGGGGAGGGADATSALSVLAGGGADAHAPGQLASKLAYALGMADYADPADPADAAQPGTRDE
jgi:E3 ubiquitin-protein ligase SHPRH